MSSRKNILIVFISSLVYFQYISTLLNYVETGFQTQCKQLPLEERDVCTNDGLKQEAKLQEDINNFKVLKTIIILTLALLMVQRVFQECLNFFNYQLIRNLMQREYANAQKIFGDNETQLRNQEQLFAAQVHEIRQPVNAILGNLQLLTQQQNFNLNEKQNDIIKFTMDCAEILICIVGNILDVSKIQHGNFQCKYEKVEFRKCIWKLVQIVKTSAIQKGLEFESFIHQSVPKFLMIDQTRLFQVLINLISNSIKFTKQGFVKISFEWIPDMSNVLVDQKRKSEFFIIPNHLSHLQYFSTQISEVSPELIKLNQKNSWEEFASIKQSEENQRKKLYQMYSKTQSKEYKSGEKSLYYYEQGPELNGELQITIKDKGIGISKEQQKLLFQPFQQASYDIQKQFGGTGLGLWICKMLVDAMKGNITLKSHLGMGTTFVIKIPLAVYQNLETNKHLESPIPNSISLASPNSLIKQKEEANFQNLQVFEFEKLCQKLILVNVDQKNIQIIKNNFMQVQIINISTGDQAILAFKKEVSNIIIFHYQLPDNTSFEVAEKIRELQNLKQQKELGDKKEMLYLLMICKHSRDKERYEALVTPFDGFIISKDEEDIEKELNKIQDLRKKSHESLQIQAVRNIIMIIDDDFYIQNTLQNLLESLNFKIITCNNGQEGFAKFQQLQNQLQLIICDYEMPVMNGIQCIKKIRQFEEKILRNDQIIPIILCSGNEGEIYEQQAIEVGAFYITKPISLKYLQKIIEEYNLVPQPQ